MGTHSRYVFSFWAFVAKGLVAITIFNDTLPKRGESLKISCLTFPDEFTGELTITLNYPSRNSTVPLCVADVQVCTGNTTYYSFTADNKGAYATIYSLDRLRDSGTWTCTGSNKLGFNSTVIDIYTSPKGVKYVQPIVSEADLGQESIDLICRTDNCSYPPPSILWFYLNDQEDKVQYNVSVSVMANSTTTCDQFEAIYTSTLHLTRGTTFQGNIPFKTKFVCGVRHPALDVNVTYSELSSYIKFAVHVSSVTLIPGNSSITFMEGDQIMVKCITSPSRPRPQIRWWVGNESKTANINESISNSGNLIILQSEITLMLNRSDRNRLLYCDTQVPQQGTWISSFKSQINVWYPPSVPAVLAYSEGFPWLENRTGILECNISEPGNPAASVAWASTRGKPDGLSHLILENLTASDNGLAVKCNLSNNFTVLKHLVVESLVRNLEVEYAPTITFVPNQTSVTVNETRDLNVTCISDGNPTPSVEWSNINSSNVLYMRNISRHDSRTYVCIAKSISTNYGRIPLQSQKQLQLTVQFAPEMSVKVTPSIVEVNSEVRIECSAHGEPSSYKFYDWIHKLGKNEVRHIKGIQANQSTLGIIFPSIAIADMGTYICLADNGITGPNGGIVQSMEAQINVIGVPVAFVSDTAFIGETNMSASIRIPFYSNPSITDLKFFKTLNNVPIANDTDTQIYHTEANISAIFYTTDVVLQGMEAVLHFKNLKEPDFGQYTLVLYNNKGTATLLVRLKELAPPSPVEQFYFYKFLGQYMEFFFVPGFNGGYQQTFTIQFKPSGSLDESWTNTSINGLSEMNDTYRLPNGTFLVPVEKLQPGRYIFRIFSINKKNIRIYSQEVTVYIEAEPHTDANIGPSIAGIAGGIGGGVVVIVVTGVVIWLWRRHNHTKKATDGNASIPSSENYEALQAKNNEGTLYQELSSITSCPDTENSFRRNETKSTEHQPVYINTKETVCVPQDQGHF